MASTLLAVDDSVTMRKVLEITFAGPDFRVVTANSPDAALQKLKGEKIDLVITDLSLEPMNGYDLCKAIKKASPSTPVIVLSSKQNAFDAAKGSSAQADDHMDKPFDTQQMIDKVKKLLAGQGAGAAVAPVAAPAAAHVNGQMAAKLEQIGLTPAQVDAVLALSREVVERVVWEVVPVLAETLIKEELSRLTK